MPSAIWAIGLYRKTENKEEAECILCKDCDEKKTTISTKGGSTSGLVTHLRTKHNETIFFKKFQRGDEMQAKSSHGSANLDQYIHVTDGATATSVASEGLFSTARDVYNYKRMSLRPRKAEMIIFLQRNISLYNYKY